MPRVDFALWDRVFILKLICTVQMTFSSFVAMLYLYLIMLQFWTSARDDRSNIVIYKWIVVGYSLIDFGMGCLLAVAANMIGIRCRRRIVIWIILETLFTPAGIFLLMRLYYLIKNSKRSVITDPHFTRISIAQVIYLVCHFFFIIYTIDFMYTRKPKVKIYDPRIRPKSVHEPTDPQITTTESRHIRMCESFLFPAHSSRSRSDKGASSSSQSEASH